MEISGQLHAHAALALGRHPDTHLIGGSVGTTDGLSDMENNFGLAGN
jgi:hypothetical protein